MYILSGAVVDVMKHSLGNIEEGDMVECGSRLQKYFVNTVTSVVR